MNTYNKKVDGGLLLNVSVSNSNFNKQKMEIILTLPKNLETSFLKWVYNLLLNVHQAYS